MKSASLARVVIISIGRSVPDLGRLSLPSPTVCSVDQAVISPDCCVRRSTSFPFVFATELAENICKLPTLAMTEPVGDPAVRQGQVLSARFRSKDVSEGHERPPFVYDIDTIYPILFCPPLSCSIPARHSALLASALASSVQSVPSPHSLSHNASLEPTSTTLPPSHNNTRMRPGVPESRLLLPSPPHPYWPRSTRHRLLHRTD